MRDPMENVQRAIRKGKAQMLPSARKRINGEQFVTAVYVVARMICEKEEPDNFFGPCPECMAISADVLNKLADRCGVIPEVAAPDISELEGFLKEIGAELIADVEKEMKRRSRPRR